MEMRCGGKESGVKQKCGEVSSEKFVFLGKA